VNLVAAVAGSAVAGRGIRVTSRTAQYSQNSRSWPGIGSQERFAFAVPPASEENP
jgi:hypothetical protein